MHLCWRIMYDVTDIYHADWLIYWRIYICWLMLNGIYALSIYTAWSLETFLWLLVYTCWCLLPEMLLNLWRCLRNQESLCKFWILRLIYCIVILRLIYCIVTDIFCILKKLVYAHLKLALYSLWQRLDLQGYYFFSISLCHIKFIIVNYTNSCKDAIFGI